MSAVRRQLSLLLLDEPESLLPLEPESLLALLQPLSLSALPLSLVLHPPSDLPSLAAVLPE